MQFKGVSFKDMTHEQLEAAESYTADAISQHMAHLEFLRVAYQEIGEEFTRRGNLGADKSLN